MTEKKAGAKRAATKKKAPAQAAKEWRVGYPNKTGIFLCRVNHKDEAFFVNHYCEMNRRCRWQTLAGADVIASFVEWTGSPVKLDEIDEKRAIWPR